VGDIGLAAREKVIDTEDIVARLYESIAEMGAKEAGSTGDENFLHMHFFFCLPRQTTAGQKSTFNEPV